MQMHPSPDPAKREKKADFSGFLGGFRISGLLVFNRCFFFGKISMCLCSFCGTSFRGMGLAALGFSCPRTRLVIVVSLPILHIRSRSTPFSFCCLKTVQRGLIKVGNRSFLFFPGPLSFSSSGTWLAPRLEVWGPHDLCFPDSTPTSYTYRAQTFREQSNRLHSTEPDPAFIKVIS